MYKTKKDIDTHVAHILKNSNSEKERNSRCLGAAKAYYGIRECLIAKRYLEAYLNSNPTDPAEGYKFMGDILCDMGEKNKALDFYKDSYEFSKNRITLNRICDLLHLGVGDKETDESKKKWFELQKTAPGVASWATPPATRGVYNSTTNSPSSPAVHSLAVASRGIGVASPESKVGNRMNGMANGDERASPKARIMSNAQVQAGDSPTIRLNPEWTEAHKRHKERSNDEVLAKLLEQNCKIFNQLTTLTDEFKDFRDATERNLSELAGCIGGPLDISSSQGKSNISGGGLDDSRGNFNFTPNTSLNHPSLGGHFGYPQLPNHGLYPTQMFIPQPQPPQDLMNHYYASLAAMYTAAANANSVQQSGESRIPLASPHHMQGMVSSKENPNGEEDDFVPTAEFAPVIPLPPLAEQKKHLENETIVHEARAKLFRLDSNTKEWKERGIGNIKIMQENSDPTKVRVLMWREQVQKIACNHRVLPGIKVTYHKQNLKALTWAALDFSEEVEKSELFVCKFADEKQCEEFKNRFQEMIDTVETSKEAESSYEEQVSDTSPTTSDTTDNLTSNFSEYFKQSDVDVWECPDCYISNKNSCLECQACNRGKPGTEKPSLDTSTAPKPLFSFKFPTKSNEDTSPPKFTFGFSNPTIPAKSDTHVESAQLSGGKLFQLGGSSTVASKPVAAFSFTATVSQGAGESKGEHNEEGEDEFVPTAEFAPVIPLPPLVEQKKHIENETLVHEARAKLFRFDSKTKEWKERGIGNIKIMQENSDPTKVRVLMWREQVQKIACNHRVLPGIKVTYHKQSLKALTWAALDFSEEVEKSELFVCKFADEKQCEEFKNRFQEMIDMIEISKEAESGYKYQVSDTSPAKSDTIDNLASNFSEFFKQSDLDVWECPDCYISNKNSCLECQACNRGKPGTEKPNLDTSTAPTPLFSFNFPTKSNEDTSPPKFTFGFSNPTIPAKADTHVESAQLPGVKPFQLGGSGTVASKPGVAFSFTATAPQGTGESKGEHNEEEDEFVPTAEFAPVIPLPPLVEQKKHIENETLVHEARAKLFRFDSKTKEWKERGIGNIKIMQENSDPTKVRVLMWREQVQKIACNHRVLPGMKVTYHKQSLKALTWAALDFSEEVEKSELFVCKFADEKQCEEFKNRFQEMIDMVETSKEADSSYKEQVSDTSPATSDKTDNLACNFSGFFKQSDADVWECPDCYISNKNSCFECQACSRGKPGTEKPNLDTSTAPTPLFSFKFPTKSNENTSPPKFTFGFSNPTIPAESTQLPGVKPFQLGGSSTVASEPGVAFSFTATAPQGAGEFNGVHNEEEDEFVPTAEFAPVIPLPPLVEQKKGDEEESVVHQSRAKLFRFDSQSKEWKERGIGDIKIMQEKSAPSKARVLMWREQVQKIACNHRILPELSVSYHKQNQKTLTWAAADFSEGSERPEVFVCKFGNEKSCADFKAALENMVKVVSSVSCATSATEKSGEAAGDNILRDTTCSGCDGCEPDKFDFSKLESRQLPTYAHQTMTPEEIVQQSSYNTLQGHQLISQSPNTKDILTTWAEQPIQELKNTAYSGSFPRVKLFQSPSEKTTPLISETISSSDRVENNEEVRGRGNDMPNVNPFESVRIQSATGFGDIVKQGEVSGFSGGMKPFASTGTAVFGGRFTSPNPETLAQRNSNEEPEKTEEGEAEFVPTAEFTPVIPLPPLVQVKKGDEEETVIYEVRVKLFRLDSAAKEWKERGVGNMKILQDKADPTKVRLLMWRDQVQKVACNHRILPGLTVSPHMNSTKALKWSAIDFSEEIEKSEVFSCKFANEKLCEEFKSHLQKIIAFLENEESRAAIATKPDFNASTVENLLHQADASSPQYSTDQAKTCAQSESESEGDDNDDEEDDEILFEGKIKLLIKNEHDNDFKDLGDGTGHIYYDTETCVSRFSFTSSEGEIAVDHCILGDTGLEATGSLSYTWNAINETVTEYGKCQLQASFLDTESFEEFWVRMSKSSYEADAAGITEQYPVITAANTTTDTTSIK